MSDTPAPVAPDPTTPPPETPDTEVPDQAAELERWKSLARKHEDRAKANAEAAKELEKVKAASMSDQEKAVAAARSEATTETLRKVGFRLVDAEVKAAAAGRSVDVDALLEGLDRSRFLDDEGEPKVTDIVAWIERLSPVAEETSKPFLDLGQGVRPNSAALNGDPLLRDLKAHLGIA